MTHKSATAAAATTTPASTTAPRGTIPATAVSPGASPLGSPPGSSPAAGPAGVSSANRPTTSSLLESPAMSPMPSATMSVGGGSSVVSAAAQEGSQVPGEGDSALSKLNGAGSTTAGRAGVSASSPSASPGSGWRPSSLPQVAGSTEGRSAGATTEKSSNSGVLADAAMLADVTASTDATTALLAAATARAVAAANTLKAAMASASSSRTGGPIFPPGVGTSATTRSTTASDTPVTSGTTPEASAAAKPWSQTPPTSVASATPDGGAPLHDWSATPTQGGNNYLLPMASPPTSSGMTDSLNRPLGTASAAPSRSSAVDGKMSESFSSSLDEWDEAMRYLTLLSSGQEDKSPSWATVRRCVEKLRDHCRNATHEVPPSAHAAAAASGNSDAESSPGVQAAHQVLVARQKARAEFERCEGELNQALQEARELQRDCEQLKMRLSLEREVRPAERKRAEERGEVLAGELRRGEVLLEGAARELEGLRGEALRHGGLEKWQVERLDSLAGEIVDVQTATFQYRARCKELRSVLDASAKDRKDQALQGPRRERLTTVARGIVAKLAEDEIQARMAATA
eukprot:gnl/TRDRNA2_/TRDRNA2_87873_c1_seq1.p1 gnl/TRDRNA2_/TRDRNA2_87873_c1~~gnl/TRDRNA2_/TRDRNA2_87873_c1_seq1.p1  ORF type:complete len:632 (+),score=119.30 gnl/TRDRNA2_/TRDRNA2_87873_c1_seq1:179-1897(+)